MNSTLQNAYRSRNRFTVPVGSNSFDLTLPESDDEAVFTGTCTRDVIDLFDAQSHVLAKVVLQSGCEDLPYPVHNGWRGTEL